MNASPTVTVRDLRNHGGDVLDRVQRGERLVVTRDGADVARLVPLRRRSLPTSQILNDFARLPPVDLAAFHADVDELLDPSL